MALIECVFFGLLIWLMFLCAVFAAEMDTKEAVCACALTLLVASSMLCGLEQMRLDKLKRLEWRSQFANAIVV